MDTIDDIISRAAIERAMRPNYGPTGVGDPATRPLTGEWINAAERLCDDAAMLAQSARVNADAAQELARINDVLRTVAHHGAVLALEDGSTVVRGRPWLDTPTHEGFWWMLTPDGKRDVVRVAFFGTSCEYIEINDTRGHFHMPPDGARWQQIDTPAVPAASREEQR